MLGFRSVTKSFGGVHALKGVSLDVGPDEVHGLIGPNGAGKTTLINLASGLLRHDSGSITLAGGDIGVLPAHARARRGIGRTFQNLRIYPNLTVGQNIEVARITARAGGMGGGDLVDDAIGVFGLGDLLGLFADGLSYGHLRRLEIVRALALAPRALMLDEPAAGMNEAETAALVDGLRWIRGRHACAMLVIDHDLKFITSVCDRVTVLDFGSVLASGTPREVVANPRVVAAYLGTA